MQHISVYSSPLFGDCFVLLRKWMCNRITEMNTDQGVGYCKNVRKVETCFKYCFSPMIKWFSPLAKAVYFALWAILIPDVMSGQDFSFLEVKNMMWPKLSQEVFSCVIIGKPWVYRSLHPSSFFLIFKEWFSCSPGCSKQRVAVCEQTLPDSIMVIISAEMLLSCWPWLGLFWYFENWFVCSEQVPQQKIFKCAVVENPLP